VLLFAATPHVWQRDGEDGLQRLADAEAEGAVLQPGREGREARQVDVRRVAKDDELCARAALRLIHDSVRRKD